MAKLKIYTGRRRIVWKRLHSVRAIVSLCIVTALGAGLLPFAPGTMGTLVGIPLAYLSTEWAVWGRLLLWVGLLLLGSWAAWYFDELMETKDNQNIVIDEVIGMGITSWTAGQDWKTWLVAFILFRFFDIVKLPPVRKIDLWSKKQSNPLWGGVGVIADDVVAGFQGLAVILVLQSLGFLAKS